MQLYVVTRFFKRNVVNLSCLSHVSMQSKLSKIPSYRRSNLKFHYSQDYQGVKVASFSVSKPPTEELALSEFTFE